MNNHLKIVIGMQLGVLMGGLAVWAGTYSSSSDLTAENGQVISEQLALLMSSSNTHIQAENYKCADIPLTGLKPTVGNVLASMLSSNLGSVRNRQSFDCIGNVCALSITDCNPWQSSECGTRFLRYEVDQSQSIQSNSFNCIDLP
jgi:hypothetical protein